MINFKFRLAVKCRKKCYEFEDTRENFTYFDDEFGGEGIKESNRHSVLLKFIKREYMEKRSK